MIREKPLTVCDSVVAFVPSIMTIVFAYQFKKLHKEANLSPSWKKHLIYLNVLAGGSVSALLSHYFIYPFFGSNSQAMKLASWTNFFVMGLVMFRKWEKFVKEGR